MYFYLFKSTNIVARVHEMYVKIVFLFMQMTLENVVSNIFPHKANVEFGRKIYGRLGVPRRGSECRFSVFLSLRFIFVNFILYKLLFSIFIFIVLIELVF